MSRIDRKRLPALILALAVCMAAPAAAEQQDIIDASQLTPQQVNYKTVEAERGSYIKEANSSATEYFPYTYAVRYEYSGAKFVEYTVKRGDEVKAGDVIARFTVTGSEVAFTRMELNLQRTEEQTQRGIIQRQEEIARLRAEIAAAPGEYEKEKKQLTLRKKEVELEQYKYRQQYSIDRQREEYNEEKERREQNVLLAPVDGVITELAYKKVDDNVSTSEVLAVISSEEVMLLRLKNEACDFRYNMPVRIIMGNSKNQTILTGRIVAADDAIPEKERTGYAFVQLDPLEEEVKIRSPKIQGDNIRLDNVILVPRSAATLEAGKHYVTKLTDGMVQKRYVEFGQGNAQYAWIMTGVEEGETLVLD